MTRLRWLPCYSPYATTNQIWGNYKARQRGSKILGKGGRSEKIAEKAPGAAGNFERRKFTWYFCNEEGQACRVCTQLKAWVAENFKRKFLYAKCTKGPHRTDTCKESQGVLGKAPITPEQNNVVALIACFSAICADSQLRATQIDEAQPLKQAWRDSTLDFNYKRVLAGDSTASAVLTRFPVAPKGVLQVPNGTNNLAYDTGTVFCARRRAYVWW